jgi:hypothetical protein
VVVAPDVTTSRPFRDAADDAVASDRELVLLIVVSVACLDGDGS